MPEISKITLPSNNTYDIKDATARSTIASEVTRLEGLIGNITSIKFVVAWDGSSAPVVANIPAGVTVTYNGTTYTGTKAASSADAGTFYLVHSGSTAKNTFDEYVIVGSTPAWEKIGTTDVDLSGYVTDVSLSKQTDVVLGEATTFTNSSSSVSFSGGTTDVVLGEATTFTASGTAVAKTTKYLSASASGTAVGANGTASVISSIPTFTTDEFMQDVTAVSQKLVQTTVPNVTGNTSVSIPNVTNAGSASTWSFTMGTGSNAETLIISGANSVAPTLGTNLSASKVTLGTAKTVATGTVTDDVTATGAPVITSIQRGTMANAVTGWDGSPSSETVLKGVKVTSQPTITLTANTSSATGRITYVESLGTVTQPTITVGTNDKVTAIKTLGTGTAAAQTITVGTNDKVTALTSATDVSVTR